MSLVVTLVPAAAAAEARVELELVMQESFSALAQQQWYKLFTELKVDNLRIRKAGPEDKVEVKTAGSESRRTYRVTGMLTGNNELVVPGRRFSPRDRAGIADWLKQLREQGPAQASGAAATPFGLTREQFAEVHDDLARPVDFPTDDLPPAEAVAKIAAGLSLPFRFDRGATASLNEAEPLAEDLAGVSSGTALAYLVRPAGLVFEPRRTGSGSKLEYVVHKPRAGHTPWPVGWPPEKKTAELVPELMEKVPQTEIENVTVSETLAAIGERLETPILYDHVTLARQGLDPDKIKVSGVNGNQWWYRKILERVLFQSRLKGEWRVDEAGKPLLWVTSFKENK